jgi:chromosome segregation ATPase
LLAPPRASVHPAAAAAFAFFAGAAIFNLARHIKQLQVEAASLQALLSRKDAELSRIEAEREARAKADALATSKRAARAAQSANRLQAAQRELAGARDQLDAATQDAAALRQQLWAAQSEGRSLKSRLEAALAEVQGLKEVGGAVGFASAG